MGGGIGKRRGSLHPTLLCNLPSRRMRTGWPTDWISESAVPAFAVCRLAGARNDVTRLGCSMPLCCTIAAATAETLLAELSTRMPEASIRDCSATTDSA